MNFNVPKHWLYISAGLMWSLVGLFLCRLALSWLIHGDSTSGLIFGSFGLFLALLTYKISLVRIAEKNIQRISSYPEMAPFFGFMSPRSYFMILIMVPLGYTLRHSMIPKSYLASMYLGMGGSLFLASLHYYYRFRWLKKHWKNH